VETIDIVRFAGALVLVLGLIALAGFLARRLGLSGSGPVRGPRSRRLGVVEALTLDPKRRLVLVRRDNVEHLLLLGPDGDLVVDQDRRRSTRPGAGRAPSGRAAAARHPSGTQPVMRRTLVLAGLGLALLPTAAAAQSLNIDLSGSTTSTIFQLIAIMTVLSLAPSILVVVTSFTRIVVVLSFLRSALGLQQTPPNTVLVSLPLFLTAFIMAPTLTASYDDGIRPPARRRDRPG